MREFVKLVCVCLIIGSISGIMAFGPKYHNCKYKEAIHTLSSVEDYDYMKLAEAYDEFLDCYHGPESITEDCMEKYLPEDKVEMWLDNQCQHMYDLTIQEIEQIFIMHSVADGVAELPYGNGNFYIVDDRDFPTACYAVFYDYDKIGHYCPYDPDLLDSTTVYEWLPLGG